MSVALYMDAQVPRAISDSLRLRDVDILTAQDDHMANLPDSQLLNRAQTLHRVVFTFDDDFLSIATQRQREDIPFAGVVYAHPLRCSIAASIRDLEIIAKAAEPGDLANRVEFLPFRK